MVVDFGAGESVRQLRRAGHRPTEPMVRAILKAGPAAFGPLLELATNIEALHDDPPECFAPLHALRLLGELPDLAMIEPLFGQIPVSLVYPDEQLPKSWADEAPQMVARIGPAAVGPLWAYADDTLHAPPARGTALFALVHMALLSPELRQPVVEGLRQRLGACEDSYFNGFLVAALADLGVGETYHDILALYRAGKINSEVIPFAVARQMLLGKGSDRQLCAKHSLWERYDEHGPFPSEDEV